MVNSERWLSMSKPEFHQHFCQLKCASFSFFEAFANHSSSFIKPLSTQRNKPAALYWAIEYLFSISPMLAFECLIIADGMIMQEPLGNLMASLRSQSTKWLPSSALKSPKAAIAHQPQERLAKSLWGNDTVLGPMLNAMAANAAPL